MNEKKEIPTGTLSPLLAHVLQACGDESQINPTDTRQMAILIVMTSLGYYDDVKRQAQKSFNWALTFAGLGTAFIIGSVWFFMFSRENLANISLIGAALIDAISAINFGLYWQTSKQFAGFHICLERMDRYLLANSFCENLTTGGDACRSKMIEVMANAPMLTLEQLGVSKMRPAAQMNYVEDSALQDKAKAAAGS